MPRVRATACQAALFLLLAGCSEASGGAGSDADGPPAQGGGSDTETGAGHAGVSGAGAGRSGSPRGDAGGSASAGSTAPSHTLATTCRARCAAAEPEPSESPDCENGNVSDCDKSCVDALSDTDEPCAQCKLDQLTWLPANGGCGEWECVCWEGYAELPGETSVECADACASTLERRAQTRLASPVPASFGRAPDAVVELDDFDYVTALAIGGDDRVWAHASGRADDPTPVWLAQLNEDLSLASKLEPPAGTWPGRAAVGLLAADDGDALLAMWTGQSYTLARFSSDGTQTWNATLEPVGLASQVFGLAWTPEGNVLVTLVGSGLLAASLRSAVDGRALWSGALTETAALGSYYAIAIDAQGRWRLPGAEAGSTFGGSGVLVTLDNSGSEDAPVLMESSRARFVGNRNEGLVTGVATHEDGSAVVFGNLREDRDNGASHLIYSAPFVARLGPDGQEAWRFEHADIVTGTVYGVALDAEGNVYAVSSEDPVEDAALPPPGDVVCSVYGCDGLVVRKWSPSGELLWEYQHREAAGTGYALALDSRGRLFVGGGVKREASTAIMLRFDPD